jgi:hypothetical protein
MRRATPTPRRAAPLPRAGLAALALLLAPVAARAQPVFFSTGNPDGRMAMASRPDAGGKLEIEAADDFPLSQATRLTSASFIGLLTGNVTLANIGLLRVEIYRIFPKDSDVGRTSGPPTFSTPNVPTRVNSPSDVAFVERESLGGLTFSPAVLAPSFTALNSVLNGINPKPGQTTGGEGSVTGQEVRFDVTFTTPIDLPTDHYFFIPQVEVLGGEFFWLSAPRPIVAPGTPFPPGFTDLQTWMRDGDLDPDWLRTGTDIVGGSPPPTFNGAFTLSGAVLPEPSELVLVASGLVAVPLVRRRRRG